MSEEFKDSDLDFDKESNSEPDSENDKMSQREKEAKWYVVHTYSGHENKVKDNIEKMVANRGYIDDIFQVEVPMEEYIDSSGESKTIKERKMFPSYVFVKMIITDTSWYLVRNTRGVTGFVGPGSEPAPLSDEEVKNLGVKSQEKLDVDLKVGDSIKVKNGPFEGLVGKVEEIDTGKFRISSYINIFGRDTLVELDFDDIEKI